MWKIVVRNSSLQHHLPMIQKPLALGRVSRRPYDAPGRRQPVNPSASTGTDKVMGGLDSDSVLTLNLNSTTS